MPTFSRWPLWVRVSWILLILAALASRVVGLEAVPLAPSEATRALGALDAVRGRGWPQRADSPALLTGHAILFTLFGPDPVSARLIPAVAGLVLVLLPLMWRRQLGTIGALAASGLFLLSPLVLGSSRQASGTSMGLLAAGLLFTAVLRTWDSHPPDRVARVCVVIGVGLGLVSGPIFIDLLLSGLVTVLLYGWTSRHKLALEGLRRWLPPVLWGIGLAAMLSLAGGFRWTGWAGVGEPLAAWLEAWGTPAPFGARPRYLLLYEPALLILLLIGLGWTLMRSEARSEPLTLVAAVWGGLALALIGARGSGDPSVLAGVVIPWAWVGGAVLRNGALALDPTQAKWLGLHALAALILWIPAFLGAAQHTQLGLYGNQPGFLIVLGAIVLIAMQALVAFLFALVLPTSLLWRGAAAGGLLALLFLQGSFAFGLSFVRPTSTSEPAVVAAASPDLAELRETLDQIGVLRGERRDALEVAILDRDPDLTAVLRWALRDFRQLRTVSVWPTEFGGVMLTPESISLSAGAAAEGSLPQDWRGTRFVALTYGQGTVPPCDRVFPPQCPATARWFLYREGGAPALRTYVMLWRAPSPG